MEENEMSRPTKSAFIVYVHSVGRRTANTKVSPRRLPPFCKVPLNAATAVPSKRTQ